MVGRAHGAPAGAAQTCFMNRTSVWKAGWLILCALQADLEAEAKAKPAAIFTDNAVLQQNLSLPVWGTAVDGQTVTVKINGQEASSPVVKGKWLVRLKPMSAGGPFTMTIAGENTVELKNILIGEVWLCGG